MIPIEITDIVESLGVERVAWTSDDYKVCIDSLKRWWRYLFAQQFDWKDCIDLSSETTEKSTKYIMRHKNGWHITWEQNHVIEGNKWPWNHIIVYRPLRGNEHAAN